MSKLETCWGGVQCIPRGNVDRTLSSSSKHSFEAFQVMDRVPSANFIDLRSDHNVDDLKSRSRSRLDPLHQPYLRLYMYGMQGYGILTDILTQPLGCLCNGDMMYSYETL